MGWIATSRRLLIFSMAVGLELTCVLSAQQLAKRLILKDGSYQLATRWEKKGERIRYLSAERGEWEEVPDSMVDWPATEQFEKERKATGSLPAAVALERESAGDRARDQALSPLVAPGLRLPPDGKVLILDGFENRPQLVEVAESEAEITRRATKNVLHGGVSPIAGAKQDLELQGAHAQVQAHLTRPAIYVNTRSEEGKRPAPQLGAAPSPPQAGDPGFRLLRLQVRDGRRIVGNVKLGLSGTVSEQQQAVAVLAEPVSPGWLKLTPREELAPGEYAVVEVPATDDIPTQVWDFEVNPAAPPNPAAIEAQPAPPAPQGPPAAGALSQ